MQHHGTLVALLVASLVAVSLAGAALPVEAAGEASPRPIVASPRGSALPDYDGDGYADLAVGAPYTWVEQRNAGAVHVIYGSPRGPVSRQRQIWTEASEGIAGTPKRGDQFGWALASGDFDGDGFTDLAIGARRERLPGAWNAGAVYVIYGSAEGLRAAESQRWSQDSPGIRDQAERGDRFGTSLIAADLDGDGRDDLVVGVPFEDEAGEDSGVVQVIYGSPQGLLAARNQLWSQDSPGIADRAEALDGFGRALSAGDTDGDGIDDLMIGVPYESRQADRIGIVHVLLGTRGGLSAAGSQIWSQDSMGIAESAEKRDQFGQSLASADFDGDGFDDLAVGVWFEDQLNELSNEGGFHIIYGSRRGLQAKGNQFWDQSRLGTKDRLDISDRFGQAFAAADLDGDGFDDLAVGSPSTDLGDSVNANRGAVHIFRGSRRGLTATGDRYVSQDRPGVPGRSQRWDHFGESLAAADFDGDGFTDLAIGIPWKDLGSKNAGAVYVMRGSDIGPVSQGGWMLSGRIPDAPGDGARRIPAGARFGWSMASAQPASGTSRTADPQV